jgi:vacuolar-type H+-ATPase subunit F/Vma7
MTGIVVIADELTAAGFRLAGARVLVTDASDAAAALAEARTNATLVLVTAPLARALPPAVLAQALTDSAPLTIVVDDLGGTVAPPDLDREMRTALGVEGP